MARRTLLINCTLAVAIIVIGVVAYSWLHTSSKPTAARQTATVSQGSITSTVSASGNVSSAVNVGVSFNGCSGVLTSIAVKPGDTVTVGQTLATANNSAAETALASANTSLAQAQAAQSNSISSAQTSLKNAESSASLDASQAYTNMTSDGGTANGQSAEANYNGWLANGGLPAGASPNLLKDYQSFQQTQTKDNQQVASARTALSQAEASTSQQAVAVTSAQSAVTTDQTNVANCTLTSPIAATVITVNGTVGATPGSGSVASGSSSSSSSSSTGSTGSTGSSGSSTSNSSSSSSSSSSTSGVSTSSGFITMADMSQLILPASVTESDIANVKTGDPVAVVFAALTDANDPSGTTVAGTISEVDLTSTVSSSVVSYGVTISLTSPPADLRLGQSGSATITTSSKQNVLRLSSSAITTVGPRKTVTLVNGSTTQLVVVTTGLTGNGETEIDSGLKAGDVVDLPATASTTNTFNLLGGTGLLGGGGR